MALFVGRSREASHLDSRLDRVGKTGDGIAMLVRGRRQVGKSTLISHWLTDQDVPSFFFTASRRSRIEELRLFAGQASRSALPNADLFADVEFDTWDAALRLLGSLLPDQPSVVVIDELPYIVAGDEGFEGTLQTVWDRVLSRKPVLLILIGSDLSMMEALDDYGRPFYGRSQAMVINPLDPAAVGTYLGTSGADTLDGYLVTGGMPALCAEWGADRDLWTYLEDALWDPFSVLTTQARRILAAEFPGDVQARSVLTAIGSGERTNANIQQAAGLPSPRVARALGVLRDAKRVIASEYPISTTGEGAKSPRHRVDDAYLRFWLRFVEPRLGDIERQRGDLAVDYVKAGWNQWVGNAIEPVIRDSLNLLAGRDDLPGLTGSKGSVVGSYWNRSNNPQIDLVVADKEPRATRIDAVGSIKWRADKLFDRHDLHELEAHRSHVATDEARLVAVSRSGFDEWTGPALDSALGPDDILAAWR
jgi:AAA+ ATPase superfamily predicted ATPase